MTPAASLTATAGPTGLIDRYEKSLIAADTSGRSSLVAAARSWWTRFGGPEGFAARALEEQLAVDRRELRFVHWLITHSWLIVSADYVAVRKPFLGSLFKHAHPLWRARFDEAATGLGFRPLTVDQQWNVLAQICATTPAMPDRFDHADLRDGLEALIVATRTAGWHHDSEHRLRSAAFGLEATLFHLGVLDRIATNKRRNARATSRADKWAGLPDDLIATAHGYLDQMAVSLRPSTIERYEVWLRQFAVFLADHEPPVVRVREVARAHIESYKLHLSERASARGKPLHSSSVRDNLLVLRNFFERLLEWGHPDAPARVPIFAGDIPIKPRPLPRFLDDAAAAKLLRAARAHPDLFTRVCVEILARTGLRRSELLGLTTHAMVQIGATWWLRIPVGKLHNDRYIPLHPDVKDLFEQWLATRPTNARSDLMFIEHGRPISPARVNAAVANVAATAGLDKVTPHQLRHTLATQAINRGMSLEAIAALLGHRSMDMTLTYARIADRTVADEYFTISEKIEALYDNPARLPADAEGDTMAKLRRELHQRLLGNGWCARPPELDCHFETICESCTFFATGPEFLPVLQAQHDDATAKGHTARRAIYQRLIADLDEAS
jgi:site-specific recombinase XerD